MASISSWLRRWPARSPLAVVLAVTLAVALAVTLAVVLVRAMREKREKYRKPRKSSKPKKTKKPKPASRSGSRSRNNSGNNSSNGGGDDGGDDGGGDGKTRTGTATFYWAREKDKGKGTGPTGACYDNVLTPFYSLAVKCGSQFKKLQGTRVEYKLEGEDKWRKGVIEDSCAGGGCRDIDVYVGLNKNPAYNDRRKITYKLLGKDPNNACTNLDYVVRCR